MSATQVITTQFQHFDSKTNMNGITRQNIFESLLNIAGKILR